MVQARIMYSEVHLIQVEEENSISALSLMIIQECNMRCKYCYGEGGEFNNRGRMTEKIAFNAIDYLVKNTNEQNLAIAFIGGEPLLNFSLIKSVIKYCNELKQKLGINFSYTMTTNGTLINKEIEDYLITNNVVTQISIDGTREKHDINRVFANQKRSYDKVIEKTESMRKQKLLTARATLTNDNIDYIEIFEHLDSLGFRAIPIAIAQNMVDDEVFEEVVQSYKEYIKYFGQLIADKKYEVARKITDIVNAIEKIESANERSKGCGAVKSMYAVDINGALYPCHRFVGEPEYYLGDIYNGGRRNEFLDKLSLNHRPECSKCWAKNLCLGGCPYENYKASGDIDKISKRNCRITKMLFEDIIKIYVDMTEEDKENLFQKSLTK
jgi:uncharacterized protein